MAGSRTLLDALEEASACDAGYTFLAAGGGARIRSYAQMLAAARRTAGGLRRAGLCRGDVVALAIADAESFLTTLFGAVIAGLVPASLAPPPPAADRQRYGESAAHALRASTARLVVTADPLVPGFEALRAAGLTRAAVLAPDALDGDPVEDAWRPSIDDVALVQYTSGSTSSPKGIVLTHRNLAANIDAINGPDVLACSASDCAVSWLPLSHDMGLVGMSLCPMYCAVPSVLMTPDQFVRRPLGWLRAIARYRGTISFAPGFAYDLCVRRVKDEDLAGLDLSSWRIAGCGAEPINAATLEAFARKFAPTGFRWSSFLPSYGLAEHVLAAAFPPRDRPVRIQERPQPDWTTAGGGRPARFVSCGRPLPGHAVRIVGEDGHEAEAGAIGEIALAGPSIMQGYFGDEALTARTVRDGWLHTGDLGYLSDGELFVCGRSKDVIVVHGCNYHPQDLEWGLDAVPGLRRGGIVAFGAALADGTEGIVVVAEPNGTVPAGALAAAIRRRIGDLFGLPTADVVIVPGGTIGRTTSGKVQRGALRAQYRRGELTPALSAGLHV